MANTYDDYANLTRSSKLVLCHVEPKQRHTVFTLHAGAVYKKTVSHFVINVTEDGTALTEGSSSTLSAGEFYYDAVTSELYVRMSDDLDPKTKKVITTYRLFYSNRAIDLPYDLASGTEVHYEGRLKGNTPISKQLDDEQIGVVLETSTNITLENTDGFFDDFYDVLIFENKDLKLYSWNENLPLSECRKIFDGIIQDKSFSTSSIRFNCKDFTLKLREPVATSNFTTSDGDIPDRYLNTPKRRLFGKFKKLRCVPIDAIKDGYELTGTVSGTYGTKYLTGTGTSFLSELTPEDEIIYETGTQTYKFPVSVVGSNVSVTLSEELPLNVTDITVKVKSKYGYRGKNRSWHIAGHKLRSPSTTVTLGIDTRRFEVADVSDIFPGDLIKVDGESIYVKRISGNQITLETSLQNGTPNVFDTVVKNPLSSAYVNGDRVFIDRDWTVINGTSGATLELDPLAEFNIAPTVDVPFDLTFTNASRLITVSGTDMNSEVKPRDWIRSDDITHTTWYEILSVVYDNDTSVSTITVRTSYGGANITTNAQKKNVNIVGDDAVITVDTMGQERSGIWIKTASDAVKDMLENDIGFTNLDAASFTESDNDAPFALSYAVPSKIGGTTKQIKDAISDINKSVFGSLVTDNNFNLKYQVLTCEKPTDIEKLEDDDLSSGNINIKSRNEIVRKVNARYAHFVDAFNGEDAFELYEFTNEFVDDIIGIKSEMDIDVYLYDLDHATTIAQRYALYNSLSQATVTVRGKLNLYNYVLNSKVYLSLDRLYKRFSNLSRLKIGIVNKVSNNGSDITIEFNDLGNAYNRAANISDNTTNDYTSSTEDEKIKMSWIVDDDVLTPDVTSDTEIYSNLIN